MDDDSIDDDVFESKEPSVTGATLGVQEVASGHTTPSPTGYRDYQPPAEVLRLCQTDQFEELEQTVHKTILLGDSGVGKTSLLVQFDTGKFQSGNYSATVGIGFTMNVDNFRRVVKVKPQRSDSPERERDARDRVISERDQFVAKQRRPSIGNLPKNDSLDEKDVYDIFCKVVLLGDSGVGKTCILVKFRDGMFLSGNYISTVGIDFRNKIVTVDESKVKLQIWDTAGQERFRSVTHAYYRDAHALLLLYDVTNKTSFDNIRAWLGEIREYAQDDVVIMLLGNKCDCGSERVVKKEDGERLAREYNVTFMETSAKTGLNVELAFLAIARELKSRKSNNYDASRFNVQDYVREQTQHTSCPPCNS